MSDYSKDAFDRLKAASQSLSKTRNQASYGDIKTHDKQGRAIRNSTGARESEHEHVTARINLKLQTTNPETGNSPYDKRAYRKGATITIPKDMANLKTRMDLELRDKIKEALDKGEVTDGLAREMSLEADIERTIEARDRAIEQRLASGQSIDELEAITDEKVMIAAHLQRGGASQATNRFLDRNPDEKPLKNATENEIEGCLEPFERLENEARAKTWIKYVYQDSEDQSEANLVQGHCAEDSRQALLQGQGVESVNLNEFSKGRNVPLLDHSTSEGFESNKGYADSQRSIDHLMELQSSEEMASSASLLRLEKAAKFLDKHRQDIQEKGAWPTDLPNDATKQDIKNYIRETTKVAVPSDKLPQPGSETLSKLEESVHANPEFWNVDQTKEFAVAVAERVAEMAARFVSNGQTSDQLQAHAERSVQAVSADPQGASSPAPEISVVPPQPSPTAPPFPTGPSNTPGTH